MYLPETETLLRHHLHAGHDIGDLLADMDSSLLLPSIYVPATAEAELEPEPLELALGWVDWRIPVSLSVYLNDERSPLTCGGARGGLLFLRIPGSRLRPGSNRLAYFIHFWASGWKYQLWEKTKTEMRKLNDGKDSTPDQTKPDMVNGEAEILR
jgi:hypothetical protein